MLRDATPDDRGALRSIFRRASLSNEHDRAALLAAPEHLVWREPTGPAPFRVRVSAGADGVVAGFATVVFTTPEIAELDDLFVDPALMRRGIGLALVSDAARVAAQGGCSSLVVTANPHAAAFYAVAGFAGSESVATPLGAGTRLSVRLPISGRLPS